MVWQALDQHLIAKAVYPFAKDVPHALKLRIGDTLVITSKYEDWYHGYCILKSSIKSKPGIFPANHIKIIGNDSSFALDKRSSNEFSTDEIKTMMKTTITVHTSLIVSYMTELERDNDSARFCECESHLNKLIELYYEIANWSANRDILIKYESQLIYITKLNSLLGCDTAIRFKPFTMTSVVKLPLIELENMYHADSNISFDQKMSFNDIKPDNVLVPSFPSNYCLQLIVENFEFIGYSDEFILQWMIIDILTDTHHETFWQPIKEIKKGRPSWMGEKFIYTDISEEMTKDNFYLVVYVYRIGQLLTDPNKQPTSRFRRPLAFGSCSLKELSSSTGKTTITLNCINDSDFLKSAKEILKIKIPAPLAYRLVQISSTAIDQSRIEIDGSEESHILRSISLQNDKPYEYNRNSLYIKLDSAEFEKANKGSPRNVEAQIFILDDKGGKMPCFSNNVDRDNKVDYYSYVTYHSNSPKWKDIIKVNLTEIWHEDCHILINFYHCSTKDKKTDERKYFACCFLKLSEFLESGCSKKTYNLSTQKLSESAKQNPKNYLSKNANSTIDLDKTPSKEFCRIELYLCSTFISNNKNINNFLKMRFRDDLSILFISECLTEIKNIKNEDFLKPKLRQEIMDTLKTQIIDKVYKFESRIETELFITWQTLSYKYIQFQLTTELTTYLKGYYAFLDRLLKGIQHVLSTVVKSDISFEVINITLNSIQPLFDVLSTITDTDYQYEVSQRLKEILKWFLYFFQGSYTPESANDIRTLILTFTVTNLTSIYKLLSIDVVIDYFIGLFVCKDFKYGNVLAKEKLEFFNRLLNSDICRDCFDVLIIWFSPTVDICLMNIEIGSTHLLTAIEVMLHLLNQCKILAKEDRVDLIRQSCMQTMFSQSIRVFKAKYDIDLQLFKYTSISDDSHKNTQCKKNKNNEMVETKFSVECIKLYTLLVAYLEEWVEIKNEDISLKEHGIVLENIRLILGKNIYPNQWLSMHLKVSSICGSILKKISRCFENNNDEAYDTLALSYFEACFSFIMQNSLQLQNFPFAKSQAVLEKYGDMRVDVMDCFLNVWKNKPSKLDGFDKDFIVQVTRKVLNISFISVSGIRTKTMPLLVNTITNWLDKCGDLKEVLNDLISETELLLRDGRCDETYHETLIQILELKRMSADMEEVIGSFAKLINLHLEYRKISSGSNNVLHTQFLLFAFMRFYQENVVIFSHFQYYSNKFSQLLESEEHYFEAALVLKQQYDCMHWESDDMTFDDIFHKNYDGTGNEQIKEQLGKRIIELLNQAKEYEYAVELCHELHGYYLNEYKYKELNPLLKQWARYLELIMTDQRLMLNYYRVTFIGGTLPSYMRQSRDYIVKGSIWFKTATITSMLQGSFPNAKIKVYQSSPPTESKNDANMTIYLAKMEPMPSDLEFVRNNKISFKIRRFYKDHKISSFFSDHPYHKGVIDKNNEVKSLYVSRVIVITSMSMPNEFMWNPIIHEEREIYTPIDVAIETVLKKNIVIQEMMQELEENPSNDMRPFTMLLNGTLDAGVNGGMPKYIEAFFSEPYEGSMDINLDLLNCFRNVLLEQKDVLTEALALHKKLAPPAILPMHERLEERLNYLKQSVIDLEVARKRSFSNLRSVDDIYAQFHDIMTKGSNELEDFNLLDRERVPIRDTAVTGVGTFFNPSEETRQSSNCSSPSRQHLSSNSRSMCNSQSELDLEKTNLLRVLPPRRLSSADEDLIDQMAHQYVKQQKSVVLTSANSTPDMRPLASSVSIDDSKSQPLKSPPLPPKDCPTPESNKDSSSIAQLKTVKSKLWDTIISRGKQAKTSNAKKQFIGDIF